MTRKANKVPAVSAVSRFVSPTWLAAACSLCGLLGIHVFIGFGFDTKGWSFDDTEPDVVAITKKRPKKKVIRRIVRRRPSGDSAASVGAATAGGVAALPAANAPKSGGTGDGSASAGSADVLDDGQNQDAAENSEPVPCEVRRGGRDRRVCGPMPNAKQEDRHRPDVYFLDAVMFLRLSSREQDSNLLRWLQWVRFAGVERVYLYDTGYRFNEGCAIDQDGIAELVSDGFVVIKKWDLAKWPNDRQLQIWQDVNRRFPTHHWRMYLDVDEYILAPNDTHSGFVKRYLMKIPQQVGVIQIHNFLFGGLDLSSYEVNVSQATHSLPERYFYRYPDDEAEADTNTKYIAHMSRTCSLSIYFARPCEGFKVRSTMPNNMRFNHYNVRRTAGMKFKLIEDRLIEDYVAKLAAAPVKSLPANWRQKALDKLGSKKGKRDSSPSDDEENASSVGEKPKGKRGEGSKGVTMHRRCSLPPGKPYEKAYSPNAYFLDAAIYVRMTSKTPYAMVMQWLLWAQYAGAERIYMYDIGYLSTDKCVSNVPGIGKMVTSGFLIIKKWDLPKWPEDRQLHIWRDVNGRYPTSQWRMYLSIEEYVFSPSDYDMGFARRLLERTASQYGAVQLQNFVFSGDIQNPDGYSEESLYNGEVALPEKHLRRVADGDAAKDFRTKYIAHMQRTCALLIHTARPCDAFKLRKPTPDKIRFHTYETSWQPDDASDGDKLVEDRTMAKVFRRGIEAMNHTLNNLVRD